MQWLVCDIQDERRPHTGCGATACHCAAINEAIYMAVRKAPESTKCARVSQRWPAKPNQDLPSGRHYSSPDLFSLAPFSAKANRRRGTPLIHHQIYIADLDALKRTARTLEILDYGGRRRCAVAGIQGGEKQFWQCTMCTMASAA